MLRQTYIIAFFIISDKQIRGREINFSVHVGKYIQLQEGCHRKKELFVI